MAKPWCPPLPTIGRAGPRIDVLPSSTLLQRLEDYFCTYRSVPDIFERRVPAAFARRALRTNYGPRYLSEMTPGEQQSVLLRNLYFKVSASTRSKMRRRLEAGALNQVRAWFQTADAVCLPWIISSDQPDHLEVEVDVLTNWSLENCAHNYARFQSELKGLKKRMRKSFALHFDLDHVECPGFMTPYWRAAKKAFANCEFSGPADMGRFVLLWCQTRATGMADAVMIRQSFEKFKATVQEESPHVELDPEVIRRVCRPALGVDGTTAKVSVGTTACLEMTRAQGGKTSQVSKLARTRSLRAVYNFRTLEEELIEPRPIRSAKDLVNWAIYQLLHSPTYTSCVRVHAVAEPSKARTITVAPYAYQVIMGVFAHTFQPALRARSIKSGLKADRHLWRFLTDVLNPQNKQWEELIGDTVYSLSTDLSEATDWGNRTVSRAIWQALIEASDNPDFPLGLAVLAKSKYNSKRFCFLPNGFGEYELVIANRGWLMGDMMTKVILTLSHQYCCELSGLTVYTLVGDDEIALHTRKKALEGHLRNLSKIFKVSELDTFISSKMAFYCEEGTLVPQKVQDTPHVRMRRGQELDYLDYPRLRLLLPEPSEVDAYSMTNIGRFSLLGKETRWVHSTQGTLARRYFDTAGLLQHLLVPQEPDTLSPYTPIEIGGDGAFPPSGRFMRRAIDDKSRSPRETYFRLSDLLNQRFSHKFVRSERLDKVVNKHHLYLPKIEGLKKLLPPESILEATANTKALLTSFKHSTVKDPQAVFFDLAKGLYYQSLLNGEDPVEPVFSIDREYARAGHSEPTVDLDVFLDVWKNPGFKFQDSWGYFVDTTKITRLNPMNLSWDWTEHRLSSVSSKKLFEQWVNENVDLRDAHLGEILETVRTGRPLPDVVTKRLNLFFESDSYILHCLDRGLAGDKYLALITRDQRLCKLVKHKLDAWRPQIEHEVYAVDPTIWLTGRYEEFENLLKPLSHNGFWSIKSIEDPGAMLHVDYNEFDDGFPLDEEIWDKLVSIHHGRNSPVATLVKG